MSGYPFEKGESYGDARERVEKAEMFRENREAAIDALVAALEFYAQSKDWDRGRRARDALKAFHAG